METDSTFVPYLFNEGVYLVQGESDEKKPEAETPVMEPEVSPEIPEPRTKEPEAILKPHATCVVISRGGQEDHPTLQKILKAVNVTEVDYSETFDKHSGHGKYLLFGVDSDVSRYEIHHDGKSQLLFSDELEALDTDINLKKKLWEQLQKMYPKNL